MRFFDTSSDCKPGSLVSSATSATECSRLPVRLSVRRACRCAMFSSVWIWLPATSSVCSSKWFSSPSICITHTPPYPRSPNSAAWCSTIAGAFRKWRDDQSRDATVKDTRLRFKDSDQMYKATA